MNIKEKRKELSDYCDWRGYGDQCDGCVLRFKDFSCAFASASDEEIEEMYKKFKEEYK